MEPRNCLLLSCCVVAAYLSAAINVISTDTKQMIYHGTIEENAKEGTIVRLNAPLSSGYHDNLIGGEVCGYTVYKWHSEQPFKVTVEDRKTGAARITLDIGFQLDYEKRHRYNFEIAPYDCVTGAHGDRHKLHVKVLDANEFAPVWKEESYSGTIEEGHMEEEILQVVAVDEDGTKPYSKICQYHLVTENAPFVISETGYLRNTRPLKYEDQSYFQLEVKAEDCGGLISESVVIEVDVKPVCKPRWTDVDDIVDVSGHVRRDVMPTGSLDLCGAECDVTQVSVSMELETSHIGKGCDRDTYSLQTNRKICGASSRNIDLLPGPGRKDSWNKVLPEGGSLDSTLVFAFDGRTTAVELPGGGAWKSFGSSFTISTWMKHSRNLDDPNPRGSKEQILCQSDGEGLNRHHASLFVHNCHLAFLLRQEPSDDDPELLRPAEWRWALPEVCDGKWHQITINANFPQVVLYLDGKLSLENANNSETLEDWPLHLSNDVHSSRVVVGACWQGAKRRYGQFFAGHLSSLTILRNETDSDDVIQCLNSCKEKLDIVGMDEMTTGMSALMNSEMSRLTINGQAIDSVEKIVHRIGYINSRNTPTPGSRPITMETVVKCADGSFIPVETTNLTIVVQAPEVVTILLNATNRVTKEERHLSSGLEIFANLVISVRFQSNENQMNEKNPDSSEFRDRYLLDSCVVQVEPKLNLEVEYLSFPQNLTDRLGLEVGSSDDGLVIAGADRLSSYEGFLRRIQYVNSRSQEMNSRTFVLSCTELTGRFLSNQLRITLEVIHVVHERAPVAHAMVNRASAPHASHPIASDNMRLIAKSFPTNLKYDSQETGVGVAVVMVVCVGFVIMLIVLGVMRVRSAQRYKGKETEEGNGEGAWDNSSLTITVNPMDPDNMYEEEMENNGCHDDETESEDEDGIYSRSQVGSTKMSTYGGGGPIGSRSTLVL